MGEVLGLPDRDLESAVLSIEVAHPWTTDAPGARRTDRDPHPERTHVRRDIESRFCARLLSRPLAGTADPTPFYRAYEPLVLDAMSAYGRDYFKAKAS